MSAGGQIQKSALILGLLCIMTVCCWMLSPAAAEDALSSAEESGTLMSRFKAHLKKTQDAGLLRKTDSPLNLMSGERLTADGKALFANLAGFFSIDAWQRDWGRIWTSGQASLAAAGFVFLLLLYVLHKVRSLCRHLRRRLQNTPDCRFRTLALRGVQRSLLLMGLIAFIYFYRRTHAAIQMMTIIGVMQSILIVLLYTRWVGDLIPQAVGSQGALGVSPEAIRRRSGVLVGGIRYAVIAYLLLAWLGGPYNLIPLFWRWMLELAIFFWGLTFFKSLPAVRQRQQPEVSKGWVWAPAAAGVFQSLIGIGLVLETIGYGRLAVYWFHSWSNTIVVLLWAGLLFLALQEWRRSMSVVTGDGVPAEATTAQPLRWLVLQLLRVAWAIVFIFGLLLAWGGNQAVVLQFVGLVKTPISIGKINFSLMNFIFAFLILILTHTTTRIWRRLLKDRLLKNSGLESGLQDSIVTISVYVMWAFGIMVALHTFGVGTTSLAFAFGALGIGLGFGLQNIFNNFISGIILLFERPIQVGDDVEINGTWATVKKINVRSTVVQTYDNAALIIPNSDFISTQVTNWSFKDKRIRRNIDVGVAYGSDIERVRTLLLQIADNVPTVFKTPKPDVWFRDFGDSALIFRLRIWTDIDNMLRVETAIRFEIDKRFKENGIVIAFPQRDVHLYQERAAASPE